MNRNFWIGMDIGGTHVRIGAVAENDRVLAFEKLPTADVFSGQDTAGALVGTVRAFLGSHALGGGLEGICAGFPAALNRSRTRIEQAPNIRGLDGLEVPAVLSRAFGVPCRMEKDVCTAIRYDIRKYRLSTDGVLLGIYIGTGVGNVILLDGRELRGRNGAAGELGHIPAFGSDAPCGCGGHGCVENLVGGKYLASLCRGELSPLPVSALFSRAADHPRVASYLDRLAKVIATEINILDPDCVVLGGGVLAMRDFPTQTLLHAVRRYARKPRPAENLQIVLASDDEKKGVIGAVLCARETERRPQEALTA